MGLPPGFQDFERERASLPGKYAAPKGRLLLARIDGQPAGTAALRPLTEEECEAKRIWVCPEFRGCGLGRALLRRLIDEARAMGYCTMFADTLPSMQAALRLYRDTGFEEVSPYSENPTPGAVFLRMWLRERRRS